MTRLLERQASCLWMGFAVYLPALRTLLSLSCASSKIAMYGLPAISCLRRVLLMLRCGAARQPTQRVSSPARHSAVSHHGTQNKLGLARQCC
ncbi:uncharacterized protein BDV17DRAFT_148002 [Aspergillus undulatus]|uniref:uncharacterized protein n=1 Tax=Aspergillus undulatus TaxID=1810928 RepID=UPI003CCD2089